MLPVRKCRAGCPQPAVVIIAIADAGQECSASFLRLFIRKQERLLRRGVYLQPARVYFKQDTGCVWMNQTVWF